MSKTIFDSAKVNAFDSFGFGVEPSDWNALAEAAEFAEALERGTVISTGPLPAPAPKPARTDSAPSAADRAWWTAETLGKAHGGFMVEGEPVRRSAPARLTRRQEEELRWAAHYAAEAEYEANARRFGR